MWWVAKCAMRSADNLETDNVVADDLENRKCSADH